MLFEERTYVRAYEWNATFPHLKPVIELQLPRVAGSESRTPGRQWGRNGPCWCWMSDCNCDSQWRHRLCELQNNKSTPLTHCYHRLKANATILAVILLHLAISDFDVLGTFFFFFWCFVLSKRPFGRAICCSLLLSSRPTVLLSIQAKWARHLAKL